MRRAVEHRVEGLFSIFAEAAGLVVAADHKDRVVRSGGDRHQNEHVVGERRKPHDVVVRERRDDTASREQLDEDHKQHDQSGNHRPVDDQQHHHNHEEGDQSDLLDAFLTRMGLVGKQRSRPGDVGLDPRRRRH